MLTFKLKIKDKIDVLDYCKRYSFLFRKLYVDIEQSADKNFQSEIKEKYQLDSWFYESCKTDVLMKLSQEKTQKDKQLSQIKSIENELTNNIFEGKKGQRRKFYLSKKVASLKEKTDQKITFGGRKLLQKITFLSNDFTKNKAQIKVTKATYTSNRILPIYSIGEAPQKSNRKFSFNFLHQEMTFKPEKNTKITFNFYCSKNQQKTLEKLQTYLGQMPISVRLSNNFVWISFDEERLNNYEFKQNDYFREIKKIDKKDPQIKEKRKEIYKKHIAEQRERKLVNKLKNRYLAVDLNPENIGFCKALLQISFCNNIGVMDFVTNDNTTQSTHRNGVIIGVSELIDSVFI